MSSSKGGSTAQTSVWQGKGRGMNLFDLSSLSQSALLLPNPTRIRGKEISVGAIYRRQFPRVQCRAEKPLLQNCPPSQTLELLLGLRSPHGAEGLVELANLPSTVCTGKPCAFQQAPPDLRKWAASPVLWNCDQLCSPPWHHRTTRRAACQYVRVSEHQGVRSNPKW